MRIFDEMVTRDHEQVSFWYDKSTGLKAIIAVHNTVLGPALGGCRVWNYATEEQALTDVLRLSKAMTYKSAVAGLNLGGGKAVIIGDSKTIKSEALLRSFGRFVHSFSGRYITAEDVGTTVNDMELIRNETPYVSGISLSMGGFGDPSPATAWGVYHGIKAAVDHVYANASLKGRVFAVQGLGQVGFHLIEHLLKEGAKVIAADVDMAAINRAKETYKEINIVDANEIYDVPCDVFSPCALGASVNEKTIPRLNCKIVAGSANNILQNDEDEHLLNRKGILFIPDFIISSGGIINVYNELKSTTKEHAWHQAKEIFGIVKKIIDISVKENTSMLSASMTLAERRIKSMAELKRTTMGFAAQKNVKNIL